MFTFTVPWLAWMGLLLGGIPLVLHFVVRRPPARAELPTARFLTPDPRTRVALHRRPRDLRLLALRVAFLLLLGMALAGPRVVPERRGTERWVLLDRGVGMSGDWEWAMEALVGLVATSPGGVRIVAFGGGVEEIPVDALPGGHPGLRAPDGVESRYLEGFRELRLRLAREPALDSLEVVLVTRPRREGWSEGFGGVRGLLYPGSVLILEPGAGTGADPWGGGGLAPDVGSTGGGAAVFRDGDSGRYVQAALEALGRVVEGVGEAGEPRGAGAGGTLSSDPPGSVIVVPSTPTIPLAWLLERARGGDTVVMEGGADLPPEGRLAWDPTMPPAVPGESSSTLHTGLDWISGGDPLPGGPVVGARIPLAGDDGRPLAAAVPLGDGCWVASGFRLEGGALPLDPGYPRVLEELIRGCRPPSTGSGPLDAGGRAILAGAGLPSRLALGDLVEGGGRDLSRWFLAAALILAILEALMGYRPRAFRKESRS